MKLSEAIEITQNIIKTLPGTLSDRERDALKVLIEAGKQMKAERTIYGFKRHVQMPGETED